LGGAPFGIWYFKGCGLWLLSESESAARFGDGAAEFFGGFDPFLNDDFYVGESVLVSLSVGGAAGKLGDFGDKRFVGLTPVDDDLVSPACLPRAGCCPESSMPCPACREIFLVVAGL